MKLKDTFHIVLAAGLSLAAGGCFTGVESTPRIDASTVRKEKAASTTPEQVFLSDIRPEAPGLWEKGKKFRVADERISLIFKTPSDPTDNLVGKNLRFDSMYPVRSLTGDDATEIAFFTDDGRKFFYSIPGLAKSRVDTMAVLEIPFTVDMDVVEAIDKRLKGNKYYVLTPMWYDAKTGAKENGLRHIPVVIDSVLPGDANFVAAVCFSIPDADLNSRTGSKEHLLYMSNGSSRAATRNFDTLFRFDNPRKSYPEIKDDVWNLIISSKVREGMTRDECRLALGAPPEVLRVPTYSGMRERWTYSDGVFLIFDDGFLSTFRL